MTREDLRGLVEETPREALPDLIGDLEAAKARALALLTVPPAVERQAASPRGLVLLTAEWASAHGTKVGTALKAARAGRLPGAVPAPSRGRGKRRRWLVPATMAAAEVRRWR
jgi:hypothetical protein